MTKLTSAILASLSAFALPAFVHLPQAQACSGPQSGKILSRRVLPVDGATGVPTNARIYVGYNSYMPGATDHPRLQTMDGIDVAANVSEPLNHRSGNTYDQTFMLVPTAPLKANTKYRVLSDFAQVPCFQNPGTSTPLCSETVDGGLAAGIDGGPSATAVIASFTTGAGADDVAPVLTGSLAFAPAFRMSCTAGACCGPYEGWDGTFGWTQATDAAGPVFYELTYESTTVLLPLESASVDPKGTGSAGVRGIFLCSGQIGAPPMMLENASFVGGVGGYTLVALDQAGNRSQPLQAQVTLDCGDGIDGGIDGSTDGSTTPDVAIDTRLPGAAEVPPNVPDAPMDTRLPGAAEVPPSTPGTGGTASTQGTGGATVVTGKGGAPGAGGSGGTTATTVPLKDGGAHDTITPDEGCSCRIASTRNSGAGLALLAFGLLLAGRRRGRR